ncbi:MAG: outer membrane protein assembly factor BamE domain-containing protein [Candidatus Binatia bacterium]
MRKPSGSSFRAVSLLSVLAFGTGCFTVGRNFVSAPVKKIEKGVTTKTEIKKYFGEPFRTGLDDGYESWTYVYNRWSPMSQARSKDLYVVFNKDGSVRGFTYNSNLDE